MSRLMVKPPGCTLPPKIWKTPNQICSWNHERTSDVPDALQKMSCQCSQFCGAFNNIHLFIQADYNINFHADCKEQKYWCIIDSIMINFKVWSSASFTFAFSCWVEQQFVEQSVEQLMACYSLLKSNNNLPLSLL